MEHIVPRDIGGETALHNLAWACFGCNGHKHTSTHGVDPHTSERVAPPISIGWPPYARRSEAYPGIELHGKVPQIEHLLRPRSGNAPVKLPSTSIKPGKTHRRLKERLLQVGESLVRRHGCRVKDAESLLILMECLVKEMESLLILMECLDKDVESLLRLNGCLVRPVGGLVRLTGCLDKDVESLLRLNGCLDKDVKRSLRLDGCLVRPVGGSRQAYGMP